jgi:hypothetical protein
MLQQVGFERPLLSAHAVVDYALLPNSTLLGRAMRCNGSWCFSSIIAAWQIPKIGSGRICRTAPAVGFLDSPRGIVCTPE